MNCVTFCCIPDADKWSNWLVWSFYHSQFSGEWGFCLRGFSAWMSFFSYFSHCIDIWYLLPYPKSMYFIEEFPGKKHTDRLFRILLLRFDWSAKLLVGLHFVLKSSVSTSPSLTFGISLKVNKIVLYFYEFRIIFS